MSKPTLNPGSVSWGTMRAQDLIPAFVDALCSVGWVVQHKRDFSPISVLRAPDGTTIQECARHGFGGDDQCEECSWLLNEDLFDALNEHCPDCFYFGSHPGDGADYGVWLACEGCDDEEDCTKRDDLI